MKINFSQTNLQAFENMEDYYVKIKNEITIERNTAFDWINDIIMIILAFIMIYPLW